VPWFPAHEVLAVDDDEPCALGRALDAGQVADALCERCECEACAGWRREQVGFDRLHNRALVPDGEIDGDNSISRDGENSVNFSIG
jgi:hypothetical protein